MLPMYEKVSAPAMSQTEEIHMSVRKISTTEDSCERVCTMCSRTGTL